MTQSCGTFQIKQREKGINDFLGQWVFKTQALVDLDQSTVQEADFSASFAKAIKKNIPVYHQWLGKNSVRAGGFFFNFSHG